MDIIDEIDAPTQISTLAGSGPLTVWGDPVPTRLLYLRNLWGLDISPKEMADSLSAVEPAVAGPDTRRTTWLEAWRTAWTCNELVARGEVDDIPDQEPADWFAADGPELDEFLDWQRTLPHGSGPDDHSSRAAVHAAARGLRAIYVLPVEGEWSASRGAALAVSHQTFSGDELPRVLARYRATMD